MLRSAPTAALAWTSAALGMALLGSTPADAHCTCGYSHHSHRPAVQGFYATVTPVPNRRLHPRWQYAAAYYNAPRADGYTPMSGSPEFRVYRHRTRVWRRW